MYSVDDSGAYTIYSIPNSGYLLPFWPPMYSEPRSGHLVLAVAFFFCANFFVLQCHRFSFFYLHPHLSVYSRSILNRRLSDLLPLSSLANIYSASYGMDRNRIGMRPHANEVHNHARYFDGPWAWANTFYIYKTQSLAIKNSLDLKPQINACR